MCGISVNLTHDANKHKRLLLEVSDHDVSIQVRGPDHFQKVSRTIRNKETLGASIYLTFAASVLCLRGSNVIIGQPIVDAQTGSILMWNGEAWKQNVQWLDVNDQTKRMTGDIITENDTAIVLQRFLAVSADESDTESIAESMVSTLRCLHGPYAFVFYHEPTETLFYGRDRLGRRSLVRTQTTDGEFCLSSVPDLNNTRSWQEISTDGIYYIDLGASRAGILPAEKLILWNEKQIPPFRLNYSIEFTPRTEVVSPSVVCELESKLMQSMLLRTTATAPWVRSSSFQNQFAVLFSGGIDCTLIAYMLHQILPPEHTIDLLNVAFENPRVVDAAKNEMLRKTPGRQLKWDPVFAYDLCPDRKTGLKSYEELSKLCPQRSWRFVAINIPSEKRLEKEDDIKNLIWPHNTEMDLSIATALYFAARGQGIVQTNQEQQSHHTKARVLFSGLGADELFGGYKRHEEKYHHQGYAGLLAELDLDFTRIGQRNLGRDDRVISSTGREIRYPFLDEDLVAWALNLPVWHKIGFGLDAASLDGLDPAKLILRRLAVKLGLMGVAAEPKRAIQFGSRIAKMTSGRTKGTDTV